MYEIEPNGAGTFGNPLSTGQPIRGQLSSKSDQDNYSFSTFAAQQQVRFKFDAPTGNYSNYLLEVYEAGDGYANLYSQRTYKDSEVTVGVLDPGTYYFRVSDGEPSYSSPSTDQYSLTLLSVVPNAGSTVYEYEGSGKSLVMNKGIEYRGRISDSSDNDAFLVKTYGSGFISIDFETPSGNYSNFRVSIENADGDVLASTVTYASKQLGAGVASSGDYWIWVENAEPSYSSPPSVEYSLRLNYESQLGSQSTPSGEVTSSGSNFSNNSDDSGSSGSKNSESTGSGSKNSDSTGNEGTKFNSTTADDTFTGTSSSVDTITFLGPLSNYSISGTYKLGGAILNGYQIRDDKGLDGTDSVDMSVEYLKFSDGETLSTGDESIFRQSSYALNQIEGSKNADVIRGTEKRDNISALDGNDLIYGSGADDQINGGLGTDTLVVKHASVDCSIKRITTGEYELTLETPSGSDQLASIERLTFTDQSYALDIESTESGAGMVARLVIASFGAENLNTFLSTGLTLADGGYTKDNLINLIVDADLIALVSGTSNSDSDFVSSIFENVVGNKPNALQLPVYAGIVTTQGRSEFLRLAMDHQFTSVILEGEIDLIGLPYTPSL